MIHLFEKCFSNNEYIQGFKYLPSTSQLSPEKLSLHLHFFFPGLLSSSTQVPSFWQSLSSLQRFLSNFMQKDKKHVSYKIYIIIMKSFNIQYTKQLLESYIKRSHLFEKCFSNNEYIQGFKYLPSISHLSPEKPGSQ